MVTCVLAAIVVLGGAAGPRQPAHVEGAPKSNLFGDVAAKLSPLDMSARPDPSGDIAPKLNPFDPLSKPNPFGDFAAKLNPFDLMSKPNPFELSEPKCNPFLDFYVV